MSLWTWLCAQEYSHAATEKGLLQTVGEAEMSTMFFYTNVGQWRSQGYVIDFIDLDVQQAHIGEMHKLCNVDLCEKQTCSHHLLI